MVAMKITVFLISLKKKREEKEIKRKNKQIIETNSKIFGFQHKIINSA